MTEVLPCPFCGGDKPYVYGPTCNKKTPYNPADRAFPWVTCGQCHAIVPGKDWDESKESAIANWNRRAHLSQPQPVAQGDAVASAIHILLFNLETCSYPWRANDPALAESFDALSKLVKE